jgi:chromosome partitioning protein
MILLIANEKGGCGKSSLSVNLAAIRISEGHDVLLIDADRQETASYWSSTRDENEITPRVPCVQKTGKIHTEVKHLAEKYEDIIIDTGGRDSAEVRSGMIVADVLLCPFRASQFDIWTLDKLEDIVTKAQEINEGLRIIGLINLTSTNPSVHEVSETQEFIKDYDFITLAKSDIKDRIVWRKSIREGRAVMEFRPEDKKAIQEIQALYKEVFNG